MGLSLKGRDFAAWLWENPPEEMDGDSAHHAALTGQATRQVPFAVTVSPAAIWRTNVRPEKTLTAKDQVTLLAVIQRYWKGYLLQIAGRVILATASVVVVAVLRYVWQ